MGVISRPTLFRLAIVPDVGPTPRKLHPLLPVPAVALAAVPAVVLAAVPAVVLAVAVKLLLLVLLTVHLLMTLVTCAHHPFPGQLTKMYDS
jgi:hypothetical protein